MVIDFRVLVSEARSERFPRGGGFSTFAKRSLFKFDAIGEMLDES